MFRRLLLSLFAILAVGGMTTAQEKKPSKDLLPLFAPDQLKNPKIWDLKKLTEEYDVKKIGLDAKEMVVTWDVKYRENPLTAGLDLRRLPPGDVDFYDAKDEKLDDVVGELTWKTLKGAHMYRVYFDYSKIKDKLGRARSAKLGGIGELPAWNGSK